MIETDESSHPPDQSYNPRAEPACLVLSATMRSGLVMRSSEPLPILRIHRVEAVALGN